MFPSLILVLSLVSSSVFSQPILLTTAPTAALAGEARVATSSAPDAVVLPASAAGNLSALSAGNVSALLTEAKRALQARDGARTPLDFVTMSALDRASGEIHFFTVPKETFLRRGAELTTTSAQGNPVRLRIARANGVNTAVQVSCAETARPYLPLVVEYPIERDGALREMAYYSSAHPALLSPDLVDGGKSYIRTMLDEAERRLRARDVRIAPEIVDIAERLVVVEHTDHARFLNENRGALFNEILTLYALNQTDTYRYSVSSAGAGGMIQMIPSTYEMMRRLYPDAELNPDFVAGMTDHHNALEAMLLYMQRTWDDLYRSATVRDALASGIATQTELVAAGYNSNPARLPGYLQRGGAQWRTLIPNETQMYLRIYAALENHIEPHARTSEGLATASHSAGNSVLGSVATDASQPVRRASLARVVSALSQLWRLSALWG